MYTERKFLYLKHTKNYEYEVEPYTFYRSINFFKI